MFTWLSGCREGSIFRQGVGLVFLRANLAAKIEVFPPVGESERLALGNVAPANGVLDHLFAIFSGACCLSFGRGKSPLDHPIENT